MDETHWSCQIWLKSAGSTGGRRSKGDFSSQLQEGQCGKEKEWDIGKENAAGCNQNASWTSWGKGGDSAEDNDWYLENVLSRVIAVEGELRTSDNRLMGRLDMLFADVDSNGDLQGWIVADLKTGRAKNQS